jgi:hypothetical protein
MNKYIITFISLKENKEYGYVTEPPKNPVIAEQKGYQIIYQGKAIPLFHIDCIYDYKEGIKKYPEVLL